MSQRQLLGARLWLTAWNRSLLHSVFSFPCCLVFPGVTVLSEERCHLTTCPKWDSCCPVLFASQAELALSPACGSSRRPRRPQSSPPGTHFRGTLRFPVGLLRCPALASVLVTGNPRVWTTSALAPGDTALLSVTFPDPPIAALPSLSLVVISWPQSAFELMIEPRSAKSLMVSAPSWPPFKPCLSSVVMMFVSLGCRGGPALAPAVPGMESAPPQPLWVCVGRALGWSVLTNPRPFARHEPRSSSRGGSLHSLLLGERAPQTLPGDE